MYTEKIIIVHPALHFKEKYPSIEISYYSRYPLSSGNHFNFKHLTMAIGIQRMLGRQ